MMYVVYDSQLYFSTRTERGNIPDSGRPLPSTFPSTSPPQPTLTSDSLPLTTPNQHTPPQRGDGGENILDLAPCSGDKLTFSSTPQISEGGGGNKAFPIYGFRRSQSEGNLLPSKLKQVVNLYNKKVRKIMFNSRIYSGLYPFS